MIYFRQYELFYIPAIQNNVANEEFEDFKKEWNSHQDLKTKDQTAVAEKKTK